MKKIILMVWIVSISTLVYSQVNTDYMDSERYKRGWDKLMEIDGEAGEKVAKSLDDISPELGRFMIEFPFGEVYSQNKMDNKLQEIAAVSALIAQGLIPQLKVHLYAALHVGNTVNEVKEVIIQMAGYVGYPKSLNAINAFREVLAERKAKGIVDIEGPQASINNEDRRKKGSEALARIDSKQEQKLEDIKGNFWTELTRLIIEHGYGDIYSRDVLNPKYRQVATISALAALGTAEPQLKFHINAGLNVGITVDEMNGIVLLTIVYAGFPAAINSLNVLNEVIADRNAI